MPGIASHVLSRLESAPDRPVLCGGSAEKPEWLAGELALASRSLAAWLIDRGLAPGDRIGFIADNRDRWIVADLACLLAGLVDVPRARDTSTEEVAFVLAHSECRALIVENAELLEKLRPALAGLEIVSPVLLLADQEAEGAIGFEAALEFGRALLAARPDLLAARESSLAEDGLATIVYTSGTTGNPKGVMLSHANILHNVRVLPPLVGFTPEDRYLSFLPTWHTFERTLEYCLLASLTPIHYSDKAAMRKDLLRVRPTVVAGVPRLWESMAASVQAKIEKLPGWKRALVSRALALSRRREDDRRDRKGERMDEDFRVRKVGALGALLGNLRDGLRLPAQLLADRLVYARLREALGGRVRFLVSGGGALPLHVDEFFNRAGVKLLNGYGLTETSPVVCLRDPDRNLIGSAGRLLPETTWQVRDEDGRKDLGRGKKGVLWIKGPQVMGGYFKNPEASRRALVDGWFCSGDLAALTDRDDLVICGRAKDTIVLRGGENVEPENIEAQILQSPLVADVIVVGHTRKHLAALVVPRPEALAAREPALLGKSPEDLARHELTQRLLHAEVTKLVSSSRGFRIFERVPKIACLPRPFSVEDQTLTATLKKRRNVIEERWKDAIAGLFDD